VVEPWRTDRLTEPVQVLTDAFWDYPETVHLLPDERRRHHVLPRYLLSDARDSRRHGTLYVHRDGPTIGGVAAWIPPEAYPVSLRRQLRQLVDLAPALPWGWGAAREARRAQSVNRAHHRPFPPHFYLRAIGVDPARQGHGIGASLVRPVLDAADRRGVGCFLQTATPANVPWYERFGFTVAATYRPTETWPDTWVMWRDPGSRTVK
jgi:GNAT superfamily N-acetyltransferase